jgi:hypothetical protein
MDVAPDAGTPKLRQELVMSKIERRTLFVMLAIMACQAWGLSAMLIGADPARVARLFSFVPSAWKAWALGAVVAAAYVAVSIRQLPLIGQRFFELTPLKLLAIPFSLGAGAVEELLFRRMLMNWALHQGLDWPVQIAISAIAFGLLHAMFGLFSRSWRGVLSPVIFTSLLGAALALVYLAGGRDVAPCIWAHALIDMAIEPWLLIAIMSLHQPAPVRAAHA